MVLENLMMVLENINAFLSSEVITFSDQPITLGELLMIPLLLVIGVFLTRSAVKIITNRLTTKKTDPNIIHFLQRVLYIIAIVIIVITILDLINVPLTAFAFLSGAIAIGFGFGAQNIINNFKSNIVSIIFTIGSWIS